jgi:hypothetical protein
MESKKAHHTESTPDRASEEVKPAGTARPVTSSTEAAVLKDQRPAISLSPTAEAGALTSHTHEEEASRVGSAAMNTPPVAQPENARPPQSAPGSAPASPSYPGSGGRPLSGAVRRQFESAFGWDFGGVRLHTGSAAAKDAKSQGARAFTSGNHIVFGDKVSDPESGGQRHVLAHELAHVVQQGKTADASVNRVAAAANPLAASLSAAPRGEVQADPIVTNVNSPGELGVGRSIEATATAGGTRPLDWSVPGAPAGVTIASHGRRGARITANAASIASAGTAFNVQASLRGAVPADTHQRATPVTLVGITALTFTANPAIGPIAGAAPPANSAEPNRGGLAGNTATANIAITPAARPAGTTITLRAPLGATAVLNTIIPGTQTGNMNVRATDNATGTFRDAVLIINPVPTNLRSLTAAVAAGPYGVRHNMNFTSSDTTANVLNRVVGETITGGGRDDFGRLAVVNAPQGGPNPAPILALAAPANAATDTVLTGRGANAGAAGDANPINVNRFMGPGVAATLPQMTIYRQGLHYLSWTGAVWSNEFDLGLHRKSLRGAGANGFLSEQEFPKAKATPFPEAYGGPPLITLSAVTANTAAAPAAPLAAGLAADGAATANVTVISNVGGRNVIWRVLSGNIATVPPGAAPIAAGAAGVAGAAVVVRSGLTPGNYTLRVADSVFPNRRVDGVIRVVAVNLRGMNAPVVRIPVGTLTAIINLIADPGGRAVDWTVDPVAVARGVTVLGGAVAGPAAALPARTATVTRPAGFTGNVTVTAADHLRPAKKTSIVITFL